MGFSIRSNAGLVTVIALSILVVSCGGDDDGGMQPSTTGSITVTVEADGAPRSGVTVRQYASGGAAPVATQTTAASGATTFSGVDAGSWEIEIVVPSGFTLDTGESDRKSATVTAGATANVTFDLVDEFSGETIEATDGLTFSRPNLTISAGTAVRWVNTGTMLHTVTPDGHSEWMSANLASNGSTFTHTFDTPGTYEYFCQPHVGSGMTGTVTVN